MAWWGQGTSRYRRPNLPPNHSVRYRTVGFCKTFNMLRRAVSSCARGSNFLLHVKREVAN
jgi:hypothetical protein